MKFPFFPTSHNLALLILRVWVGLSMLLLHGLPKLQNFSHLSKHFLDLPHLGPQTSLILCLISEVGGSILLVLGLFTRLAALLGIIELGIAFWLAHHFAFTGAHNGQLALAFLASYFALFFAGGGKFAVDRLFGSK